MKLTTHGKQLLRCALNHHGSRRKILRSYLFDILGREAAGVAVAQGGICYVVPTRDHIGKQIFVSGGFNTAAMTTAVGIANELSSRVVAGRTFIDIGANLGTTTLPALHTFGASDAVAIEPDPYTYRLLRSSVIASGDEDRTRTVQTALSDHSGSCLLETCEINAGDNRVRLGAATDGAFGEASRPTVEVRMATFDEIIDELNVDLDRVGLVWMDTQGHEAHVLSGAASLLASDLPVVLEYWPYGLRRVGALERLHDIISAHYRTVIDVGASMKAGVTESVPIAELPRLADRYAGIDGTDLVLIK